MVLGLRFREYFIFSIYNNDLVCLSGCFLSFFSSKIVSPIGPIFCGTLKDFFGNPQIMIKINFQKNNAV